MCLLWGSICGLFFYNAFQGSRNRGLCGLFTYGFASYHLIGGHNVGVIHNGLKGYEGIHVVRGGNVAFNITIAGIVTIGTKGGGLI